MDEMQEKRCRREVKEFLFLGAPLLDIAAPCGHDTLEKYGLKLDDCIRETDQQEDLFRLLLNNPKNQKCAGGSSQNSARVAKWVLNDRGRVSFAGCVGKDDYAKTLLECLQSEGVESVYIPLSDQSTGVCACLLSDDGDRSMCARLGAAQHIAEHHLRKDNIHDRVRSAHCIFVEGYVFGHSPDVILSLGEMCSDSQIFSLGISAEYICRDFSEILSRVLPRIDVLFSNEAEAKVLAQSLHLGDLSSSVENIARALSTRGRPSNCPPRIVVVTRGPNSVLVARGSAPVLSFPVPRVKVVDGVGCGDALAGAFLAVYVLTGDVSLAAKTGISAAVEIAQVTGCRPTCKKLFSRDSDLKSHTA